MDTKALKKQMGAAIAMVLVAAIALGSATFAWFVSNNKATAKTTSISAQSNAAFMTITNGTTGASGVDTNSVTTTVKTKALYPATLGEETGSEDGVFMTGYASDVTKTDLASGTLTKVGRSGSFDEAVTGEFALLQEFNLSSKGQNLNNLKVSGVEAATTDETNTSDLKTALRVLVTSSDKKTWETWGLDSAGSKFEIKKSSNSNQSVDFGTVTAGKDTAINVYLFYEGSDAKVFTNNLSKLTATNAVTVTFEATPDTTSVNPKN